MTVPSEDSDQPGHPPGLIRVFAMGNSGPSFLHADKEDSDQTGRMPRLIWVFAGRTCQFVGFVMRRLIYIILKLENILIMSMCDTGKCNIPHDSLHKVEQQHLNYTILELETWWLLHFLLSVAVKIEVHCVTKLYVFWGMCSRRVKDIWAASLQNQQNGMCAQRRLRSAWASAQSDESLRCALSG